MRRFVLILASIFLLWGCVEKEQPMVTLGDDQSRTVEVAAEGTYEPVFDSWLPDRTCGLQDLYRKQQFCYLDRIQHCGCRQEY